MRAHPASADLQAPLAGARAVADAVLLEGYLLYPYRASAAKNKVRWQFGVLVPPRYAALGTGETASCTTEFLLEPRAGCHLRVQTRFLQLEARSVARAAGAGFRPVPRLVVDSTTLVSFQEGRLREAVLDCSTEQLAAGEQVVRLRLPGSHDEEVHRAAGGVPAARVRRRSWPLSGEVRVSAEEVEGPYRLLRVRLQVVNTSPWRPGGPARSVALRRSLLAVHSLVAVGSGRLVSLLEPPEWAREAAAGCRNSHTFPVLVGDPGSTDALLSSPIIFYDYPQIAPESPGDLFDSTETDELLALRTLTLTEAEKAEVRGTDPRGAELVDRVEAMPAEVLERLHGAVRYLRRVTGSPPQPPSAPWWDPGADASVSPGTDTVWVQGVELGCGSPVVLRPGRRGADAQDLFLAGRRATVRAVYLDVDGGYHLAVTVDDDPGAELQVEQRRFLYFRPDEISPVAVPR